MKILIADDVRPIRDRLAGLIGGLPGVDEVVHAADFDETVRVIDEARPDAIVLDMFMPGGTGLDVLRDLSGRTGDMPAVIVLTASSNRDLHRRCLEAGAKHVFEKGIAIMDAVSAVELIANQSQTSVAGGIPDVEESVAADDVIPCPAEKASSDVFEVVVPVVLVVEDHDFQRKALARLVRAQGAPQVLEAADGEEALALIRIHGDAVRLILCDLDMPKMDGMEFVRHLGSLNVSAALAISSAQDGTLLNAIEAMCRAYGVKPLGIVPKPIDPDHLKSMIEQSMAGGIQVTRSLTADNVRVQLDDALEGLRNGQFTAVYQPKVDIGTRRMVGVEALARWTHPFLGSISPANFIPVLEESGHIDELTFAMLRQAASDAVKWQGQGAAIGVSVNVSLASLSDPGLAQRICEIVGDSGLVSRHMTLEVTETAVMTDVGSSLENLARLRMRGFELSTDDFGTGFASLQRLNGIDFSELKVDREFVVGLLDKRGSRALVETSIGVAHRLGLRTVAEGVEDEETFEQLKLMGCDQIQGYLASPPVPEYELVDMFDREFL